MPRFQDGRPPSWAAPLANREIQIERKGFQAALKENPSGRFLRITEVAGQKTNTIIIPASGLRDFSKLLGEMMQAAREIQHLTGEPGEPAPSANAAAAGDALPAESAAAANPV